MAKKSWWFLLFKNLITCESKPKSEKGKRKGWRWIFDKFKFKQLPTTTSEENKSLCEAREEQRKIAVSVARATAAAAEAAVAAAQAAAEVVRLTGVSRHSSLRQHEGQILTLAAIKIQTAFRGYLARKALRALKGVIRIQAIARGRAVRRRFSAQLNRQRRCIHPTELVHTRRSVPSIADEASETKNVLRERSKHECKSQRQWIDSIFSQEEIESIYLQKQQAGFRRDRMKQYSFSHRERQCSHILEETIPLRSNERSQTCVRKQWAKENFLDKHSEDAILDLHNSPNSRSLDLARNLRIKPRAITKSYSNEEQTKSYKNLGKEDSNEEVSSPFSQPRRSFCHTRRLKQGTTDDCQLCNSLSMFPTYMAATESARAKMRSMSTPRQRLGYLDTCIEEFDSPCKNNKLHSSWSSFNNNE